MTIAYAAASEGSGYGGSVAVAYPAGTSIGDMLILTVGNGGSAMSTPAGFIKLGSTSDNSVTAYYRIADGSESGNVTVSWPGSSYSFAVMARFTSTHKFIAGGVGNFVTSVIANSNTVYANITNSAVQAAWAFSVAVGGSQSGSLSVYGGGAAIAASFGDSPFYSCAAYRTAASNAPIAMDYGANNMTELSSVGVMIFEDPLLAQPLIFCEA